MPRYFVTLIVAVALFMEQMDSTVIATSLPAIAADIGTSPVALKLAVTSYLVALALFAAFTAVSMAIASSTFGYALTRAPVLKRFATIAPAPSTTIDFGTSRAYGFASQGQLYLGELTGARNDPAYIDALATEIAEIPHPETGEPAFQVLRK